MEAGREAGEGVSKPEIGTQSVGADWAIVLVLEELSVNVDEYRYIKTMKARLPVRTRRSKDVMM